MPLGDLDDDPATHSIARFGCTVMACAVTTVIAIAMRKWLDPVNLVMLYLLDVVLVTIRFGRIAGVVGFLQF